MNRLERLFFQKTSSANLQFDSLDGLRGLAVLFVVLSHLSNAGFNLAPVLNFAGSGKYGVFLFFVLSAFLLTFPLIGRTAVQFRDVAFWSSYALRRVLRIFPLYVVVLLVSYLFSTRFPTPYVIPLSGAELLDHLTLQAGKSIYWTVPVEFKYYLVLPFVAAGFALLLRGRLGWGVGGIAGVLALLHWLWPARESTLNTVELIPYLPIFLPGSLAAFVHWKIRQRGGIDSPALRAGLEATALASLLGVISLVPSFWNALPGREVNSFHFHRDFLLFGFLWSVFAVAYLNGTGIFRWILASRPLRYIGVVSFSVYLWHLPILVLVGNHLRADPALVALAVIALALLFSGISYLLIERPFIRTRLARRFIALPASWSGQR
jgi:peptidoglycan/LPS O-acetylase OafA/YrhL